MVLNMKIDQARKRYDCFVPYTDGKGPITRLNLRRLKPARVVRQFGESTPDAGKVNKYINDLCKF